MTVVKENAKMQPASYYCRHMVPGVVGYSNENILLDADTIKRMMPSMMGKPVYVNHQTVDLEKLSEQADGFVFDMFYNELDGWFWSRFTVHTDEAHQAIAQGWKVSNAYLPTEWADGGQYLAIDYKRKIVNGEFTHLAIVASPRYEDADILTPEQFRAYNETKKRELTELQNSKEYTGGFKMFFKIFRKADEKKTEVTNASDVLDSDIVEYEGKEFTVAEFKEKVNAKAKKNDDDMSDEEKLAKKNAAEKEAKDAEEAKNASQKYNVDGEDVSMKDLMDCYRNAKNMKKNEDDEAAKKKEAEKGKENAKFFEELRNANTTPKVITAIDTQTDKISRGKANY